MPGEPEAKAGMQNLGRTDNGVDPSMPFAIAERIDVASGLGPELADQLTAVFRISLVPHGDTLGRDLAEVAHRVLAWVVPDDRGCAIVAGAQMQFLHRSHASHGPALSC